MCVNAYVVSLWYNFVCVHAVFEKVFLKTLHDEEVSHLLHLSE